MTIFPFCFALGEPKAVDPAFYIENLIEMEMEEGKGGGRKGRRVVARSKLSCTKKLAMNLEYVATMWKDSVTLQAQVAMMTQLQQVKAATIAIGVPRQYLYTMLNHDFRD